MESVKNNETLMKKFSREWKNNPLFSTGCVLILMIILAKSQAKRSFAVAMLILMILAFALVFTAFLLFPYELSELAAMMRGGDAVTLTAVGQG